VGSCDGSRFGKYKAYRPVKNAGDVYNPYIISQVLLAAGLTNSLQSPSFVLMNVNVAYADLLKNQFLPDRALSARSAAATDKSYWACA